MPTPTGGPDAVHSLPRRPTIMFNLRRSTHQHSTRCDRRTWSGKSRKEGQSWSRRCLHTQPETPTKQQPARDQCSRRAWGGGGGQPAIHSHIHTHGHNTHRCTHAHTIGVGGHIPQVGGREGGNERALARQLAGVVGQLRHQGCVALVVAAEQAVRVVHLVRARGTA